MSNSFTPLQYDKVWTNANDFPTYEDDETKVRADMQYLFDAIKSYINGTGESGVGLLEEIAAAVAAAIAGTIPDGSIETRHFDADAVAPAAERLSGPSSLRIANSDGGNPGSSVAFSGSGQATLLLPTLTQMGAATAGHNHDGRYSFPGHAHDDRYYTEAEINSQMSGKANTAHTHDDRYYTEAEINSQLSGKAPTNAPSFTGRVGIAGTMVLSSGMYGSSLPAAGEEGQLFFLKKAGT